VLVFTYGLDFYLLSGMIALAIGCIGMFFAIFFMGEIIEFIENESLGLDGVRSN
jgi:hypothetical protein